MKLPQSQAAGALREALWRAEGALCFPGRSDVNILLL